MFSLSLSSIIHYHDESITVVQSRLLTSENVICTYLLYVILMLYSLYAILSCSAVLCLSIYSFIFSYVSVVNNNTS